MIDARIHSPACERNRDPILRVLEEVLPSEGTVLEIASGTGMHGAWFAPRLPGLTWQPSDQDELSLASIDAWRRDAGAPNLRSPVLLDVLAHPWPVEHADAIFNANMIHIAPWETCPALFEGARRLLAPGAPLVRRTGSSIRAGRREATAARATSGTSYLSPERSEALVLSARASGTEFRAGVLVLYGPFMIEGAHTAPSNAAFDASLRARDPRWGVRELEAVTREAVSRGFTRERTVEMPANNLALVFTRDAG